MSALTEMYRKFNRHVREVVWIITGIQIDEKNYDTDLKDRGIKDIVKNGIAFAGKKVEILVQA